MGLLDCVRVDMESFCLSFEDVQDKKQQRLRTEAERDNPVYHT